MNASNSEGRKRAAENAVAALKSEVAREVAAEKDAEIERLRAEVQQITAQRNEAWNERTEFELETEQALQKLAAVAALADAGEATAMGLIGPQGRNHGRVNVSDLRAALADHDTDAV